MFSIAGICSLVARAPHNTMITRALNVFVIECCIVIANFYTDLPVIFNMRSDISMRTQCQKPEIVGCHC